MRDKIQNCLNWLQKILKSDKTLTGMERTTLKNCEFQLKCIHQYIGEKGKEESYLYALDNMNKLLDSTKGIKSDTANEQFTHMKEIVSALNKKPTETTSPRGEKRDHADLDTTPGSSPRAKKNFSSSASGLFSNTEQPTELAEQKPAISIGQHRKKSP